MDPSLIEAQENVELEDFPTEDIDTGHFFVIDKFFVTLEEMKAEVENVGRQHNIYIINISFNDKRGVQWYGCDRSLRYRPPKRKSNGEASVLTWTRKCNCPFRLRGVRQIDNTWRVFVHNGHHNHFLDSNPYGHAKVGKVNAEIRKKNLNLSKSHISVADILSILRKDNDEITAKQIYNIRQRERAKVRENRTATEQLLKLAIEHGYRHWYQTIPANEEGVSELTDILFCHPCSLDILQQYHYVLIVDSTYNTNKYKMPLLEVVGVTPTKRNYSIFFGFLQNEKETAYNWAMKCIREVFKPNEYPGVIVTDKDIALMNAIETYFPNSKHLLCKRHIEKDVEAWVKKKPQNDNIGEAFAKGRWSVMVKSLSEEEFLENEKIMYNVYSKVSGLENYCKDTWINQYKEKFVFAWTNKVLHLGNITTNRVEGAHASLKRYLRTSVGSFDNVWEKIDSMVKLQQREIKRELGCSKNIALRVKGTRSLFRRLTQNVSHAAIKILDKAYKKGICNGCVLKTTHGLPCSHELVILADEGKCVELNSIHPFWRTLDVDFKNGIDDNVVTEQERFYRLSEEVLKSTPDMIQKCCDVIENVLRPSNIVDPAVKKTRGRPKKNYTTRDPSYYEHIEREIPTTSHRGRGRGRGVSNLGTTPCQKLQRVEETVNSLTISTPSPQVTHSKPPFPYPSMVPYVFEFILEWYNPIGDGNCGFRAIAYQIYSNENEWPKVRRELLDELMTNFVFYSNAFGSQARAHDIANILSHWKGFAPKQKWMPVLDLGFVVATLYNLVFVCLSMNGSTTCLPLKAKNQVQKDWSMEMTKFVTVILVNDHFYWVRLDHNSPYRNSTQVGRFMWKKTVQVGRMKFLHD